MYARVAVGSATRPLSDLPHFKIELNRGSNFRKTFGHKCCGAGGSLQRRRVVKERRLGFTFGDKRPDTGIGFALDLNVEASREGNLLDSSNLLGTRVAVDFGRCRGV